MQEAVRSGDLLGYSELNRQLHALIRTLGGQSTAQAILERLRGQNVRHQFRLALHPGRAAVSLPQHLEIIEALCAGDGRGRRGGRPTAPAQRDRDAAGSQHDQEQGGSPMRTVVVTDPPRADVDDAETLGEYGVATVHEALGRVGYLGPELRPAWPGARIGGTAVTVLCWPGDNLMIHVAVEQCRPGDVLVVATNSPSTDGLFGELFATALQRRGVRGVVLGCGVRDVADLREMRFPVWSRAVSAQGTVKATAGAVNVPIVLGGQTVRPGRRGGGRRRRRRRWCRAATSPRALTASQARVDKEAATPRRLPGRRAGPRPLRPARAAGRPRHRVRRPTRSTRKEGGDG